MTDTFVSHLECSLYGETYPAGEIHGLSRAGQPLLVRYDLEAWRVRRPQGRHRGERCAWVLTLRAVPPGDAAEKPGVAGEGDDTDHRAERFRRPPRCGGGRVVLWNCATGLK